MNPLHLLWIVPLAGLGTSAIEYFVGYNAIDWLKDHILAFVGRVESVAHAQLQRAKADVAKLETEVAAIAHKAEFWKKG